MAKVKYDDGKGYRTVKPVPPQQRYRPGVAPDTKGYTITHDYRDFRTLSDHPSYACEFCGMPKGHPNHVTPGREST